MGKKRSIDPGLQFLQEIGFDRIRGEHGLANRLKGIFGEDNARQIWDKWESSDERTVEFYDFKNSDPEISKAFSEAFDGDIIRKACNYIAAQKDSFGKNILEVGCESGYMTCFLAKMFPDAHITAIDRSSAAIEMAKRKIDAFGLNNVDLRVVSLEEVTEQFDTVFCMRTILENISSDDAPFFGEPLLAQFIEFEEISEPYTKMLISSLNDSGNLCVFERIKHDPLMCGWMMSLCNNGCAPDLSTYSEIKCEEAGGESLFQAFVCRNNIEGDLQKIIHLWSDTLYFNPTGKKELMGLEALVYLSANAGRLVQGVRVCNSDNKPVGRFAIFHDNSIDDQIYYLYAGSEEVKMFSVNSAEIENVIEHLQKTIEVNKNAGFSIMEINPDEDFLEGKNSSS